MKLEHIAYIIMTGIVIVLWVVAFTSQYKMRKLRERLAEMETALESATKELEFLHSRMNGYRNSVKDEREAKENEQRFRVDEAGALNKEITRLKEINKKLCDQCNDATDTIRQASTHLCQCNFNSKELTSAKTVMLDYLGRQK